MEKIHLNFFKLITLTYQKELHLIKEFRLTIVEHYTLQTLDFFGQITHRGLADKLAFPKSTLTYVLNSLEERGLIERKRDKNDRRSYFVSLTEKGRETVRKIQQRESVILLPALSELSNQERAYWNKFLGDMVKKFEGHIKKEIKKNA